MARGRRAVQTDTRPGQILALALLACAPIALAFIVSPLLAQGARPPAWQLQLALYATPLAAVLATAAFVRTPAERRAHRAARIGVLLALVALGLWALLLVAALQGRL